MKTSNGYSRILMFVLLFAPSALADNIVLQDWTFYLDGATFNPPSLPAAFDTSGFDFGTGLGSVILTLGPGDHTVIFYLDQDITGPNNPVNDESGFQFGAPASGLMWEVDEPGFTVGDLVNNVLLGSLDDQILDGSGTHGPQDIAMAIGWSNISVSGGNTATLTFQSSTTGTPSGFYLEQTDPDGTDLFFSSFQGGGGTASSPEPGSWVIFCVGIAIVARILKSVRAKADWAYRQSS